MSHIQVIIEDSFGRPLRAFTSPDGKLHIAGKPETAFQLRIKNRTGKRVEAVASVDGRDVMTGEKSGFTTGGYLITAYGEVVVKGWRRGKDAVAEFFFSAPEGSYSAQSGSPENVGVIGVAVFNERVAPAYPYLTHRTPTSYSYSDIGVTMDSMSYTSASTRGGDEALSMGGMSKGGGGLESMTRGGGGASHDMGTGYGRETESKVRSVSFTRASPTVPEEVVEVHYHSLDAIKGQDDMTEVDQVLRRPIETDGPSAFPNANAAAPGFAQPPSNWQR